MTRRSRRIKAWAAALLALLLIGSLLGCQQDQSPQPQDPEKTYEKAEKPTLPLPAVQEPDDTLRVAVRTGRSLHPLNPGHEAASALLRLVYEPLFDAGPQGRIQGVIARSLRWSPDQLTCTLTLDTDRTFHNGRPLAAEDVRASMLAYLASRRGGGEEEEERGEEVSSLTGLCRQQALENILSVNVGLSNSLVIRLLEADPNLPALLTFPILPAEDADLSSAPGIPGTGPWIMASSSPDGSFTLVRHEAGGRVRRIQALAYGSASLAAAAFDRGEVDLLYMDVQESIQFADRSRIRKQFFTNGGYISLVFKSRTGGLDERDAFLYRARQMGIYELMAAPLQTAFYPIAKSDPRLAGTDLIPFQVKAPTASDPAGGEGEVDASGRPEGSDLTPFKLLVPQGLDHDRLIDQIGMVVRKSERRLTVEEVVDSQWLAAVRGGQYDALLLVEAGGFLLDPADYLEGLRLAGLWGGEGAGSQEEHKILSEARGQVMSAREGGEFSASAYSGAIGNIFRDLPVAGLAYTASMVWYSNDIEGTLTGTWNSPFEGVEDLLIWRR